MLSNSAESTGELDKHSSCEAGSRGSLLWVVLGPHLEESRPVQEAGEKAIDEWGQASLLG